MKKMLKKKKKLLYYLHIKIYYKFNRFNIIKRINLKIIKYINIFLVFYVFDDLIKHNLRVDNI